MAKRPPAKKSLPRHAPVTQSVDPNRDAALSAGCTFYIGQQCDKHPEHGNVRYAQTGLCKECYREYSATIQRTRYAKKKTKRQLELLKSDPNAFTWVAFNLGSVEGIRAWVNSTLRKFEEAAR